MENFNPIGEEQPIKTKSNKLIFVAIFAVIAVAVAIFVMKTSNPKFIFDSAIDEIFDCVSFDNYETAKVNMDLEIKLDDEEDISEFINNSKISIGFEDSKLDQEQVVLLKLEKEAENMLDVKVKLDSESEKAYIDLGEFFNKTLEVDISESLEADEEMSAEPLTFMQMLNAKKAKSILKNEIKEQLEDEYFSTIDSDVDGKKSTKNSFIVSEKELSNIVINICENLAEDEDFMGCFEEPEKIEESLEEIIASFEEDEMSEDLYLEISIYTQGIFKKVNKVGLALIDDIEEMTSEISYEVTILSDEEFEYKVFEYDEKMVEGTVKIENEDEITNFEISSELVDDEKIVIKGALSIVYDEDLTKIDTSNSVNVDDLNDADMMALYGNFMGSKLYKEIENIMANESEISAPVQDDKTEDIEDIFENNAIIEDNTSDESDSLPQLSKPTSTKEPNKLITYNDQVIRFNIPSGYELYSSDSDAYKLFDKEVGGNDINVDVSIDYNDMDGFKQDINRTASYLSSDYYSNVEISQPEEIEVNGNKFKKIVLSYDYSLWDDEVMKCETIYFAHELDDENLYVVEIEGANYMTSSEIETFLTIQK